MPTLIVIPMSFGDKEEFQFPPDGISFYLYRQFFFESSWMDTTFQSFRVALITTALALVFGVSAAYGIVRGNFPGKQVITIFLLSPILVPVIVVALGLYLYLSSLGITGTTFGIVLGHVLHTTPFVIVMAMAGLKHVDPNLESAARVMGAGRLYTLVKVTLPLLKPTIVAGALFAFLISFDEVVISYFISSTRTETLPVKMYSSIQWEISPVLAAISTLLTVLSLVVCVLASMLQKNEPRGH
ncbi:MAG: ABC transporter permease [Deltaproteobacteria bacterium]|nr:ABC transporter permease [Deltaproteobacteria bacterium]MBW2270670.1 ABC transporter permease [Deltaproteobacteria bacterium]MBW2398894.1 ABC transporter permease [Deltaproteobacteria bacterium]